MKSSNPDSVPQLDKAMQSLAKGIRSEVATTLPSERQTFEDFIHDKLFVSQAIRQGIPYGIFELIAAQSPFSFNDWVGFLDISSKSMQRYKSGNSDFRPIQSEKILEIAEVTQLGLEVFGETGKFKLWLNTPSMALGKMKPIELLRDSFGKDLVMTELNKIEYGVFV